MKTPYYTTASQSFRHKFKNDKALFLILFAFIIVWVKSYFHAMDLTDWWIENLLVFIFIVYFTLSYKSFKFSTISYLCIVIFVMVHVYGAEYVYTKHPIGFYLKEKFNLTRNPYDRIVHFSFGFLLAYPLIEFLKNKFLTPKKWVYVLAFSFIFCLASTFELIEWLVSVFTDSVTGETYVATQGDVWDAHKDIAIALVGYWLAVIIIIWARKVFKSTKTKIPNS